MPAAVTGSEEPGRDTFASSRSHQRGLEENPPVASPFVPKVALFVTCIVDQLFPDIGVSSVRLLEAAGVDVEFPEAQTCCGQPAMGAGEPDAARRLARHHLDVFGAYDAVVAPSGSCSAMAAHWYPELLAERAVDVASLAGRTFELSQYLADELGRTDLGATVTASVTVHDACHGLRHAHVGDASRRLLTAAGASIVEMDESETCCGFGGAFGERFPELAGALADEKLRHAARADVDYLVSGDAACLAHLEGRRRRTGSGPRPVHFAELLAAGLP